MAVISYDEFQKQLGAGKYRNSGRLRQMQERPEEFYNYFGKTGYEQHLNYYKTKAAMEEYGLDQSVIAPGYSVIDDVINNRDAYINKYGESGYNQLYSMAYNQAKPSIENINLAVKKKNSGLYNADILNSGTWVKDMFAYDEASADDMMNQYLGYAPDSFTKAARDIVTQAEQIKKARADSKKTTGEIAFETTHGIKQTADYWDSIGNSNRPITEQELLDAIKIVNEETGDVSVEEHNKNLAIIEYAKQNPLLSKITYEGQSLKNIGDLSPQRAAKIAKTIEDGAAAYDRAVEFQNSILEQTQRNMDIYAKAMEANALPTDLAGLDKKLEEETAKLKQYKDEYEASGKTYLPHGGIPFTYTSHDKDKEAQYDKQQVLVERLKAARQQMYNGMSVESIDIRMGDVQAKIAKVKGVTGKEEEIKDLQDEAQQLKDARYYAVQIKERTAIESTSAGDEGYQRLINKAWAEVPADGTVSTSDKQGRMVLYINFLDERGEKWESVGYLNTPVGLVNGIYGGNIKDPQSVMRFNFLSEEERNTLRYLYGKGDTESFDNYMKLLDRELDKRYTESVEQSRASDPNLKTGWGKAFAGAVSIITNLGSPGAYGETAAQTIKNVLTGKYEPVNQYSSSMQPVRETQQLRNISLEGAKGFERWLAETGYSIADFAVALPLGPTGSLVMLSSEAAGQATYDALQRGATPEQALLEGTAYGVIEAATEKLPIKNLFELAESGIKVISKQGIKAILKQAGIEATEEFISEIAQNLSDYAVMGDKSQIGLRIQELMTDKKMSRADAEAQAGLEFFLYNPLISAASGFTSGLATGRAEDMIKNIRSGGANSNNGNGTGIGQQINNINPNAPTSPVTPGLLSGQGAYENHQSITPQSLPSPVTPTTTPQNLQTPSIPAAPGTRRAGQGYAPGTAINKLKYNAGKTLKTNTGLDVYDMIPESAAPVYEGYAAKMNRAEVKDVISRYSDPVETVQNRKGQDVRVRERTYTQDNAVEVVAALEQSYKTGTKEQQQKLLVIATEVAASGRAIDKMQLLSKLNATGRKFAIERELGRINAFGRQKYKGKWNDLRLTDAEIKAIKKAQNLKELDRARKEILKRLGDAMPATMAEKAAALSKIAGQLIPQTHIKNLSRHSLTWAVIEVRDKVAAVAGLFARRELRTTSFLVGKDKKAKVNNYYKERNVADEFSKYKAGGSPLGQKRVFESGALEAASKGTSKVSATESLWFMADRYKRSLGRYMQAQGLTEVTPGAHEYAMIEAVKSVNSQKNAVTRALAKIKGIKGVGAALNFVAPSAETKVNAVIRKLEYSPFGIGKAGYDFIRTLDASRRIDNYVKQMKTASPAEIKDLQASIAGEKDNMQRYAQKAINDLAQGITGTGLYFLGLLLASGKLIPGVEITGLEPPTEEDDFLKSTGWQPLSLKIGDTYISLDWAEPISSMLLVGAETYHAVEESSNNSWYAVPLETLQALGEDILKSSGFSGIRDALRDSKDFGSAVVGVGSELVSQHIPSLGGAVNNIIEPYKISNDGDTLDKAKNKAMMSVPGLRRALESAGADVPAAATDAWGQPVSAGSLPERLINNLVSPAKITHGNSDSVTAEIKRLYDATGNADVFPLSAGAISDKLKLDKLSKREAAQIQAEVKQGFYDVISAYMSSAQYQADNDDARVAAVKGFYDSFMEEYRKGYLLRKIPSAPKAAVGP